MSVLIVTRSDDNESVEQVTSALRARGERVVRMDTDRYPSELRLSTELLTRRPGKHLVAGRRHDLSEVTAVWYRRFFAGGRLPDLGDARAACVDESRRTLYGTIAALGCFQMDPLSHVRGADHKELQLSRAAAFGLDVPRTLFSNDPQAVRRFFRELGGRVITKMQHSFAIYRGGRELVVFTNRMSRSDLGDLDGLRFCPMTFQEELDKAVEVRATVVGRKVFSAAVESQRSQDAEVDWRRDGVGLLEAWEPYRLPRKVERGLLRLTAAFGLNYAAADFVVTPDGRHVFLEINAGGEFFWLQRKPGLPIAEHIAEVLTNPRARLEA